MSTELSIKPLKLIRKKVRTPRSPRSARSARSSRHVSDDSTSSNEINIDILQEQMRKLISENELMARDIKELKAHITSFVTLVGQLDADLSAIYSTPIRKCAGATKYKTVGEFLLSLKNDTNN